MSIKEFERLFNFKRLDKNYENWSWFERVLFLRGYWSVALENPSRKFTDKQRCQLEGAVKAVNMLIHDHLED
jgi:hypothetical protein